MTRSSRSIPGSLIVTALVVLLTASSLLAQRTQVRRSGKAPAPVERAAAQPGAAAPAAAKPDAPSPPRPQTPQGSFELVEWVVLVVDAHRPNPNEAAAFQSTVPGFARGRRPAADAKAMNDPSPVGVIRLLPAGAVADDEEPIDVLLQLPAGRFLANWPQGKGKSNRQLWERVALSEGKGKPVPVDAGHWFETLRKPGERTGSPLSTRRWSERFLLYDAEVPYPNVLRVKAGEAALAYRAANAGSAALRDVQFYLPAEGGWRVGELDELPPTQAAPPAPATQPGEGEADLDAAATSQPIDGEMVKEVFAEAVEAAEDTAKEAPAALVPAVPAGDAPAPSTQPATQPADPPADAGTAAEELPADAWRDLTIAGDARPLSPEDAVAGWRERLAGAGLSEPDVDVILATLRTHALDAEQLTVVYRLEPAELDRLLPLEVVPAPTKVTRVGLVIVKNVDPAAGERIAKLIEQLASDEWDQREAAHARLAKLGAGARPMLTDALKHADLEVVYRAERLLAALTAAGPAAEPQ